MCSCILNNKKNKEHQHLVTDNVNKFCQNLFEIGSKKFHYKKQQLVFMA